jgi:acyl-CoA synthetase (AMP-forming)/AMP-acid ligase II
VFFVDSFGATETGHQGTGMPGDVRGRFFMDDSSAILDDEWRPVAPGVVGRLARRGRVPLSYYNDPAGTAAHFRVVDGARWAWPGDYATREPDGRITVLGRGAACINTGGEKVFPEEVEEVLKAHPTVADALVVGVPDARWGERLAAVVSGRPGATVDARALDAHCRASLAGYKVPRLFAVAPVVERQPSGKPDYAWARAFAARAAAAQ